MTPTCIRIKNLSVTEYLMLKIFVIIGLKKGLEPVVTPYLPTRRVQSSQSV